MASFKIKIITLFICASYFSTAQTITKPKVIKSEQYKSVRDWDPLKLEYTTIIGIANDSIGNNYLLKSDPRQKDKLGLLSIEIFDNNLKQLLSKNLEVPADAGHFYNIENYYTLNNTPTLFYSQFQKDKSKKVFYFLQLDNKGNFSKKGKMVEVITKEENHGNFEIIQSKNRNTFMVVVYPPIKNKGNMTASCFVFNDKIEKLKSFEVDFKNNPDNILKSEWTLSEEGIPFCLVGVKDPKLKKYQSSLYMYEDTNNPTQYDLNKKDNRVSDLMITLEDKDEITFVGNYVGMDHDLSQGAVFLKIGKSDKKVKIVKTYQFSDEVLAYFKIKPIKPLTEKGIEYQSPYWAGSTPSRNSFLVLGRFVNYFTSKSDYTNTGHSFVIMKFGPNGELLFEKIQPYGNTAYIGNEGIRPNYFIMGEELGVLHNNREKIVEKIKKGIPSEDKLGGSQVSHANSGLGKRGDINLYLQAFNSSGQSRFIQLTNHEVDQISVTNNPTWIRKDNSMVVGIIGLQSYGLMKLNF